MARQQSSLAIVAAVVFVIFVSNLILIVTTHKSWTQREETDSLVKEHLLLLNSDISITNWLLKDALHKNAHAEDKEKAVTYFSQTLQLNSDFLKAASEYPDIQNDTHVINSFKVLHDDLSNLYNLANARWGVETAQDVPDSHLNSAFNTVTEHYTSARKNTLEYLENGLQKRQNLFMAMVIMFILTNTLLIILLYLFNRSKNQSEKALIEQKQVFETLLNKSFDGVLIMEKNKIIDTNESMIAMLMLTDKAQMLGAKLSEFSPEFQPDAISSAEKFRRMIELALANGHCRFEWQLEKADGELFFAEMIITHISMNGKDILHIVSHDISERKALADSLEQKSALYKLLSEELEQTVNEQSSHMLHQSRLAQMGEMISMIAHQWRQPLASISAISGTLSIDVMMDAYKKEFFQERLETISDLSQHLSSTIDDFRNFFKATKEKEPASWEQMVEGSLKIIGPTLTTRNITVETSFENSEQFYTYPNEVKQVILNIIKNAEDILLEKEIADAQLWVHSFVKEGMAYLTIEDNAGGIPDDIINNIFDPYFSTKEKKDGTGLGLYMSRTIITEHCNGSLKVQNTPRGALFEIALPLKGNEES